MAERPDRLATEKVTPAAGDTGGDPSATQAAGPPPTTSFEAVRYSFLATSARPGELGRLGPYRVVQLLGEGGMGFVFRAEDDALQRPVALKVMRPEVAAGANARERFLREGRTAAALKSDHIITIYQVGEANGVPFLAMEFLEGSTLEDWLRARPVPVPTPALLRVAKDVLKGLVAAHEKGLIHRDIKPANLWLETRVHRIKLLDFGLTRAADGDQNLTREGMVIGTPSYMAPEQAAGRPVDGRADLFSLGVVLYRMLAGRSPFQRSEVMATLMALAVEVPPPAASLAPNLPADLAALIDLLMAKDPAHRPATAAAALALVLEIEKRLRNDPNSSAVVVPSVPVVYAPAAATEANPWEGVGDEQPTEAIAEATTPDHLVEGSGIRRAKSSTWPLVIAAAVGFLVLLGASAVLVREVLKKAPESEQAAAPTGPVREPSPRPPTPREKTPRLANSDEPLVDPARPPIAMRSAKPSPLDALDPATIPAEERMPWLSPNVVAVIGSHRGMLGNWDGYPILSPDGKWLGSGGWLFDAATHRPRLIEPSMLMRVSAFSADGKTLAVSRPTGGLHGVRLIDLSGAEPRPVKDLAGRSENGTHSIVLLADGKTLATGTGHGGIYLWDTTGPGDQPVKVVQKDTGGQSNSIQHIHVTADSQRLTALCATDGGTKWVVRGWSLAGAAPKELYSQPVPNTARGIAVTADGNRVLAASRLDGNTPAVLTLWDVGVAAPKELGSLALPAGTEVLALAPLTDGRIAVLGGIDSPSTIVDIDEGTIRVAADLPPNSHFVTPDLSRTLTANNGRIQVLDSDGRALTPTSGYVFQAAAAASQFVTVEFDEKKRNRVVRVWSVRDGVLSATDQDEGETGPLRVNHTFSQPSPDGTATFSIFVNGSGFMTFGIDGDRVRPKSGKEWIGAGSNYAVWWPDGKSILTQQADNWANRWDMTKDPPEMTQLGGFGGGGDQNGKSTAISPAGDLVAVTDHGARTVTVYAWGKKVESRVLPDVPDDAPLAVAFTPDGRNLLVGYVNSGSLRRFDLTKKGTPAEVLGTPGYGMDMWLAPHETGPRLLIHLRDKLSVWDLDRKVELLAVPLNDFVSYRSGAQAGWADDGRHIWVKQHGVVYVLRVPGAK